MSELPWGMTPRKPNRCTASTHSRASDRSKSRFADSCLRSVPCRAPAGGRLGAATLGEVTTPPGTARGGTGGEFCARRRGSPPGAGEAPAQRSDRGVPATQTGRQTFLAARAPNRNPYARLLPLHDQLRPGPCGRRELERERLDVLAERLRRHRAGEHVETLTLKFAPATGTGT